MKLDFKLILITSAEDFIGEVEALKALYDYGLTRIHLRKPEWSREKTESFLSHLPVDICKIIRLHDHYDLYSQYNLNGIHLNSHHENRPDNYNGLVSYSCHSLAQVVKNKPSKDYVFLSPIFDSISKDGYDRAFSELDLQEAKEKGYIDSQVVALGGVNAERISFLKEKGFGGAAILGAMWSEYKQDKDIKKLLKKWEIFQQAAKA